MKKIRKGSEENLKRVQENVKRFGKGYGENRKRIGRVSKKDVCRMLKAKQFFRIL